jgi:hypothetical protein
MRNIRSSQLLVPFGIGQIVVFPNDESIMICGLDSWEQVFNNRQNNAGPHKIYDILDFILHEPRLQELLNVNHFRRPFPYFENGRKNQEISIPGVRFPGWHYCMSCGTMVELGLQQPNGYYCTSPACPRINEPVRRKGKLIPVRFVAACPSGHIQDVPFKDWVHRGKPDAGVHILKYDGRSGSGDLSSIRIRCSCGVSRSLAGLMNEHALTNIQGAQENNPDDEHVHNDAGIKCYGYRPWLGLNNGIVNPVDCQNELRVLIRGGSNVHYSYVQSAIYLPQEENRHVEAIIHELTLVRLRDLYLQDNGAGDILRIVLGMRPEVINNLIGIDYLYQQIIRLIEMQNNQDNEDMSELTIRLEEYRVFNKGYSFEGRSLKAVVSDFQNYNETEFLSRYFDHVTLIEKLKETKVFTGFSRIDTTNDHRTQQERINELSAEPVTWLPAVEVYGEGIFLKFRDEVINEWLETVGDNNNSLLQRYMAARNGTNAGRDVNSAFIMMHTFAHLLIKRLCFNCGYGSSSLRERIYFSSDNDTRMNGILVYTSSGDSEGSMGGLIRQGREMFLARNILEALEDARWCSSDPVCSEIGRIAGQGPDSVNGAACHNCAIVPETSCEEYNCLLDRSTLVNIRDGLFVGFFKFD